MKNCLDCDNHKIIADPDPDDWFCDDDKAVVCKISTNPKQDLSSKWKSDHHANRSVTRSCRPYNLREESTVPEWCPLSDVLEVENGT